MLQLKADIPKEARDWRNDPSIWHWCRQYTLIDEASHARWLSQISQDPTIKMFGLYDENVPVGVCGLTSIDRVNQKAEFSLYIAKEYQNRGYGAQALSQLLEHGFSDMNLNRIWGETYDGNPAAGLFQKLGLHCEGKFIEAYFRNGFFISSYVYAITRKEWYELNPYRNRQYNVGYLQSHSGPLAVFEREKTTPSFSPKEPGIATAKTQTQAT